jgi:transcription elongation factor GreA
MIDSSPVRTGHTVTLRDTDTGSARQYVFVDRDAEPALGRFSAQSPVALAVLGHHVGECVTVHVPRGDRHMEILSVA